ncbi:hypothetical protein BH09VER1_BH09VER1_04180 [soil metagenome]
MGGSPQPPAPRLRYVPRFDRANGALRPQLRHSAGVRPSGSSPNALYPQTSAPSRNYRVNTTGTTDIPGAKIGISFGKSTSLIFTGTRCTTFT